MPRLNDAMLLPCGVQLPNRFVKSAMSEIQGSRDHAPGPGLERLYRRWSRGGCGLLISGNIMIDRQALGEPKNVVVEDRRDLAKLQAWSAAGQVAGNHFWAQLNHPGKQSPAFLSKEPVAPSAIPLAGDLRRAFNCPRALHDEEIMAIVQRFGVTAAVCKEAGFSGVQIHGAHGYLASQFLSPRHNKRQDRWGGSLDNRMRFILETYHAMRSAVGPQFPIGIKLNSADFQADGFSEDESLELIRALSRVGIDLIEVSGGNYESPKMMGGRQRQGEREAYFADFCQAARQAASVPIVLTGGFRSAAGMQHALDHNVCDLIGLARPLTLDPELPAKILGGQHDYAINMGHLSTGWGVLDRLSMLNITWYESQIARLAAGREPDPDLPPLWSVISNVMGLGLAALRKRRA